MKLNVAGWDRVVRVILGIVLLYLGFAHVVGGGLGVVADILGAVLLLTGIVGFCPLYALLGLSTRSA